jgi:hypothetical protein
MFIPDVNRREYDELIEHFESRPSLWRNVVSQVWARYEGESVVAVVDLYEPYVTTYGDNAPLRTPQVEVVWLAREELAFYIDWVIEHFTSHGLRMKLQALLPNVGPNMITTVVDMLDGWQQASPDISDIAMAEGEEYIPPKRKDGANVIGAPREVLPSEVCPRVRSWHKEQPRNLSPYLMKLIGRKP